MTGRAVALPAARPLGALWRFSRPHTIIGTTVSIVALYLIAVSTLPGLTIDGGLIDLFWTLVAGLAVNVYIVGINQLEDVEEPMDWLRRLTIAGRFVLGSLAGFVFVPVGAVLALRRRR